MPQPATTQGLLDSHEERIRDIEARHTEMSEALGRGSATMSWLREKLAEVPDKIDQATRSLGDRIEGLVGPLATEVREHGKSLEDLRGAETDRRQKEAVQEERARSAAKRRERLGAVLIAIAATIFGAVGKEVLAFALDGK